MNIDDLTARLDFAVSIAREAGQHTLRYFRQPGLDVDVKADASPVTVADREAEQLLRKRITEKYADDGIIGEEFGELAGTSGYRWILDPIDGTKSFVSGVPLYGTLIGLERGGRCLLGVIYMPALNECVYAATGQPAWYVGGDAQPVPAKVSSKPSLAQSLFCTSEVRTFDRLGRRSAFDALQSAAWTSRTWGDCYGYLLVATGRAEVMADPAASVWDAAALQPILEQAGGTFTDWTGNPTIFSGEGLATNGRVLEEVLAITRKYPAQSHEKVM
jgi:histidinol phosphatase-like enzyme (inositol monophosphatase family)